MILPNAAIIKKMIASLGSPKKADEDGALVSIATTTLLSWL